MAAPCIHVVFLLCLVPATVASPHRNLRKSPVDIAAAPTVSGRCVAADHLLRGGPPAPPATGQLRPVLHAPAIQLLRLHLHQAARHRRLLPAALPRRGGRPRLSDLPCRPRVACHLPGTPVRHDLRCLARRRQLLRGSTAEPLQNGVVWSVSKDITRYASLLAAGNSTLAVFVENLVNNQYTGVYYANVTLHLYFRRTPTRPPPAVAPADLIVPMSRGLPLNDGLWYKIENATDVTAKSVVLPSNTYCAVLQLYVSFHGDDD
uniref:Peptide N-acetyl-beta-D-glucosaminyl asparaginase amidase A N-terminal domain-containing protein n=1 Tax=Aegilops tauschii subsp. strangulata TaxID=200361 RepID=A0A453JMS2_AEGTS